MHPLNPLRLAARCVAEGPWQVVVGIALLTALALAGIVDLRTGELRLALDVSTGALLPDDDERGEFYAKIRQRFGNDDTMLVVLATDDLFTAERLATLRLIEREIRALPGVHQVTSLASATRVRGDAFGIEVSSPLEQIPAHAEGLAALRAEVLAHPIWGGSLVSRDGGAAAFVVSFGRLAEREMLESGLPARVAEAARRSRGDGEIWVTGPAFVKLSLTEALLRDLRRIVPAVLVVLFGVLLASFRSRRGALVPLLTVAVAVTWTLGTLGWLGISLTLVSAILPPLLLTVGFSYAIHVVAAQDAARDDCNRSGPSTQRTLAAEAVVGVGVAVVFTGLTTAIGFLSLALSPIHAIREFGMLAALGIAYTVVVSLTLAPSVLALLPEKRRLSLLLAHAHARWLDGLAVKAAEFDVRHRRAVLWAGGAVFALALLGVTQVTTGMDPMASFGASSRERLDHAAISARFDGVSPISVVLESTSRGAFSEPAALAQLDELERWLEADSEIADVISVVDVLRELNAAALGVETAGLPASRNATRQLLLLGAGPELRSLIDAGQQSVRLLLRARGHDSAAVLALADRIEAHLGELEGPVRGHVTGGFVQLSRAGDALARGQFHSLLAAVVVIYAVLSLMFRSFSVGLAAFVPNVLPIAVFFGVLGAAGIPLTPTTGLIACMALGIAVDDTIHYFARFNADARKWGSERLATVSALCAVIQPVSYTTVGLCAGFGAMLIGELRDHQLFGVLAALTLAVAWVSMLTVTPALCYGLRVVTVWDRVCSAFGGEVAGRVPALRGLSRGEARAVVSLGEIVSMEESELLTARGSAVYLVLVGTLTGKSCNQAVIKLEHGDAIDARGAGVVEITAQGDAQLLRIAVRRFDELRRRRPKLMATLDQNLDELLEPRARA